MARQTAQRRSTPRQSPKQKKVVGRVMHEHKHGELETSRGKKVKTPKQAIAIALHEAGASKYERLSEDRRSLGRTKRRERRGETAQQRKEGRIGQTRAQLYEEAKRRGLPGRSKMNKSQLKRALHK